MSYHYWIALLFGSIYIWIFAVILTFGSYKLQKIAVQLHKGIVTVWLGMGVLFCLGFSSAKNYISNNQPKAPVPTLETIYKPLNLSNSCFLNAVGFQEALEAHEKLLGHHWSRILVIQWEANLAHAALIFEWKEGLYVYDVSRGTMSLSTILAKKEDPLYLGIMYSSIAGHFCFNAFWADEGF